MPLVRVGRFPADETYSPCHRLSATALAALAVLLTTMISFPAGAQADNGEQVPSGGNSGRVTCDEAVPVFQLLCVAYRLIANNHVDPVDDTDLAEAAAERVRYAQLAERTEGTPPACPLPSPEFEEVCLEIDAVEDTTTAIEMAIRGMIRSLDDNSFFMTTAQYRQFLASIENVGTTGLGVALALADGGSPCFEVLPTCRPVIAEVYAGSPADRAGLMVGDELVELGDAFPAELGCEAVTDLDRFPSGTSVAVTVRRGSETISATIQAARLTIPPARGEVIDGNIGLLRLDSFGSSAESDVKDVLVRLTDTGISGLVFDLRGNLGGYVDSAIGTAGLFLPNLATIVHLVSREKVETISARGKEISPDPVLLPMVVVTDNRSASASEMVTGALHDNERVTVVGQRTYGKNTGQSSYRLQVNGRTVAVLHLTTLRWLTPDSRSALGGFDPDVTMELPSCLPPSEVASRAISAIRPRVTDIAITSAPLDAAEGYVLGETVAVEVAFTSPVMVALNGGRPELKIRIGDSVRSALYRSGSGTARLVFEYVVSESDSDEGGVSIAADSIITGRATIQLPAGLEAILSHEDVDPDPRQLVADSRDYAMANAFLSFVDVGDNVHHINIGRITIAGITRGCGSAGAREFCPDDPVTRSQMATFLTLALDLPATDRDHFTDDDGTTHEDSINRLVAAGITQGCNPPTNDRYCPDQPVTRSQMATFLTLALDLPATDRDHFTDDDGTTHEDSINRLVAAGITQGCNPPTNDRYCPDQPVARAQMATFLVRVLTLLGSN